MAAQVSPASMQPSELDTLTLDHILSDLDSLSPNASLLRLASATAPSTTQATSSGNSKDLLTSFEADTFTSSNTTSSSAQKRKEYVALSHELLASFQNAQRLNTEQVSAEQVGLLLPSERNRVGPSSASSGKASDSQGRDATGRAKATGTRTDLLHAKVAHLQTQVDAWDAVLEHAVKLADDTTGRRTGSSHAAEPHESVESEAYEAVRPPAPAQTNHVDIDPSEDPIPGAPDASHPTTKAGAGQDIKEPVRRSTSTTAVEAEPVDQDFQDDDPWSELA
ncbi:hypothetical protein NDA11_006677 [Ustilago hordei]|uniref:Uncharacterized protein n=1 Tax=Ustilago hordei TaxID=120017 RepID=I2FM40_USTHO|nr:uncharacterized protein UHO2_01490 [Ustilago hordei]KAJ1044805.1 hypothetical protein NDA10_007967 [Ustilago hordei]KAJ1583637.1 hypothetical protein NDA15_005414 [Ustilago hordei]KAJ1586844.1 hypothetical protein NDA11_006677 [Ustilago hordei]KAJ1591630.1 hypothetical protein NDA12_001722 [Ustilago hordei]KAJ1602796.1 hypothetical protein NDA14_001028 [Ustilago hordei]